MISYGLRQIGVDAVRFAAVLLVVVGGLTAIQAQSSGGDHALQIAVNPADGRYTIALPESNSPALRAGVGAEVDGHWLHAADYPRHTVEHSQAQGYLGEATDWQVTYTGLGGEPDLFIICALMRPSLSAISRLPFGTRQERPFTSRAFVLWMRRRDRLSIWEGRCSTIEFFPIVSARTGPALSSAILRMLSGTCIVPSAVS